MIKLKRRIGSAVLAVMMLLSLMPLTALAAGGTVDVNSVEALTNAINSANDGDTIKLAEGIYEVGNLSVNKAVSFEGAKEDTTIIVGSINYYCGNYDGTIQVSKLTVKSPETNTTSEQAIWWSYNTADPLDGAKLVVQNCTIENYLFGIGVNSSTKNCTLSVTNLTLKNVWCGANVSEGAGNKIQTFDVAEGSSVDYEIQVFDLTKTSEDDRYNAYYTTYDNCNGDASRKNPDMNGNSADFVKPVVNEAQLKSAIEKVGNEAATIALGADITLTSALPNISGKNLTIEGNNHTLSFDQANTYNALFGNNTNPLYGAGTKLTVKNLVIENTGAQAGYASIVGYNANGAEVTYEGCTFKNLYAAVYVNPITQNPEKGGVTLSITGCTYEKTLYGYAKDSSGYQLTEVIFTGNTGDFSTGETVKQVVYAEVEESGKTYTKAFASIQDAVTAAKDGTTITVTPGTYDGDITINKSITIKGAENASSVLTGKVTINGADMDVTLDGLKFTHHEDATTSVNQAVIYALTDNCKDTNLTVKNCVAENLGYSMFVYTMPNVDGTSPRMGTITIDNNTVSNTEGNYTAFNLWGASKHVITNNTVSNIGLGAFNLSSTVGDVLFENNTIDNVGGCGLQIANYATGESVIVRDNNIAGAKDSGIRIYSDGEGKLSSTFEITDNAIENSGHAITFYNDGVPGHKSNITGVVKASGNTYNGEPVGVDFGNSTRRAVAVFYNGDTLVAQYIATADNKVTTPAAPSRAGYSFRGWYGNGHLYAAGEAVQISKDTVFVAQWSDNTPYYTITVKDADNGTVTCYAKSAAKGADVTLNVKADVGYQLDKLTVTDASGKTVAVEKVNNTTYTFVMPGSKVTVEAVFAPTTVVEPSGLPFTDVSTSDWFYSAVKFVYENGLMDGVAGNLFAPNATLNRAMAVTILYRLEGSPAVTTDAGFNDVAAGTWYTDAVNWAAANNIVNGVEGNNFDPTGSLTREQMATVLYRYAQYKGADVSASGDIGGFVDSANVSSWAADAVKWAVGSGLVNGVEGNALAPQGTSTRAQAATVLMRFVG